MDGIQEYIPVWTKKSKFSRHSFQGKKINDYDHLTAKT
jgi:hypothetical protein